MSATLFGMVAAAGCADPDPAAGEEQPDVDTTAPEVASTSPVAMAVGVPGDAKLIITFSEPMDPGTVEAAYASTDLPLSMTSFAWSEDLRVLTISPDVALTYAEGIGTDPSSVPAKTYAISIGTAAADLAGNPLATPLELSFATKRRMVASFQLDGTLTRVANGGSLMGTSNDIWVGDNAVDNTYRGYITFDLTALPAVYAVESAQFSARQLAPVGAPYTSLGAVMAHHVSFANLNGFGSMPALSVAGTYSQDGASESKLIDVTANVADDMANRVARNSRSQYRLQIDLATNEDAIADRAVFAKDTFEMTTVYITD